MLLLIITIMGLIVFTVFYTNNNKRHITNTQVTPDQSSKPTSATSPDQSKTTSSPLAEQKGTISGNASYPSSRLPTDEEVCAVKVSDITKPICINVGKDQIIKYNITVPSGNYYVYSTAEKEYGDYKAYYNEYSKCGNSVDCPASGHKTYIVVKITEGETATNIDPSDWYAN